MRVPDSLKRRLEARARRERRSLSAQIAVYLERGVASEEPEPAKAGRFLGLYAGARVPSDEDIAEVRGMLWGSLGQRKARRGA